MNEVHKSLMKAVNIIDRRGWCQGQVELLTGEVCLARAIELGAEAVYPDNEKLSHELFDFLYDKILSIHLEQTPIDFNDKPGRTKEQVQLTLINIAGYYENGLPRQTF